MSSSTALFRNNVLVEGVLSGLTITRIDTEKTQVLNSLNQQITDFQAEQTATQSERDAIAQSVTDLDASVTSTISTLSTTVDDNKADIEGKLATETNARLSLASDVSSRNTYVDGVLTDLENKHVSDDARLTQVETDLKNVDTTIQNTIQTQIDDFNSHTQNILPRTAKLEEYLVIDETDPANPTVSIKPGVKFIVTGDFEHA